MSKWECSYSKVITSGCPHRSAPFSRAISKKQPAQLIICNEHDWEIPTAQWLNCVPAIFKSVAFVVGTKPNSCDMQLHLSMMMGHRHNYLILKKTVVYNGQEVYFIPATTIALQGVISSRSTNSAKIFTSHVFSVLAVQCFPFLEKKIARSSIRCTWPFLGPMEKLWTFGVETATVIRRDCRELCFPAGLTSPQVQ